MIKWYKDKNLEISFNIHPIIIERYICPCCSKEERKNILKKPYKNIEELKVKVNYKNEQYSFIIPKDYYFDGASIPCLFWRIIGAPTDNSFLIAAMVHDYCCENHHVINNNRYLSTLIFNALLKVGGTNSIKRFFMKHSVDNFQKFCGWRKINDL